MVAGGQSAPAQAAAIRPNECLNGLRDECGFSGGYTIVKDYVRSKKRGSREMFVPLSHPAGHAQADFGEALVVISGIEQKAYFFAFDLAAQ